MVKINTSNQSGKDNVPIFILETNISISATKYINVTIIDINAYHMTCRLEKAQAFVILIKNLEY